MSDKPMGMTFGEMGNEMAPLSEDQQRALEDLRNEGMGQETQGLPITYPRVKMLHGGAALFQFENTEETMKEFRALLIHVEPSRVYWKEAMGTGDGKKMPDCFSRDLMAPESQIKEPQSTKCTGCPHNEWGSEVKDDGTSGRGKACKEIRRLFFIPEGHFTPHWMSVPPSSLRELSKFMTTVRDKGFKKPQEVFAHFKVNGRENPEGVAYSELALGVGEKLPDQLLFMVADYKKKVEDMLTTAAPVTKEQV